MTPARIAELLAPFLAAFGDSCNPGKASCSQNACHSEEPRSGEEESVVLSPLQLQQISMYIDILQKWNAHINLTAIRDEEEIVTRHFGESLFAARHLFPSVPVLTVADIGSGAGFPGIPMKIWAPEISLTLIESNHKKATFLREVARVLTLTDIDIQNTRAESLAGSSFDVVTLRAVENFEAILPVAANLVAPQGRLALLIGQPQLQSAKALLPHSSWSEPILIPASNARVLATATRTIER
ncbi:MAG TPA: 16S rRNA (guanine(527)-N(7))-methyltransferase RsmG [Candidatus Sulfotelmatobacter sp.]|nr:16S rRNA (guanine(527)-N(7))-methyltransferase RsmG [Candidatus Sulfotelmatobacter sp.]